MAKMFYSIEETAAKLKQSVDGVKGLVRAGKLREFRDAGKVNFKVEEVDRLVNSALLGGSGSGELVLEPAEGSSISLVSPSESDMMELGDSDLEGTAAGVKAKKDKGGSVVPSVGVSVFDDTDLERSADPMAETVMAAETDPLGLEGTGSGSGLLDLTRESDDTSLGAELLDEINTSEESPVEMGDATRAGLEEAITDTRPEPQEEAFAAAPSASSGVVRVRRLEYAPDAMSIGLGAMAGVSVVVLCLVGLGAAAMVRGSWPSFLDAVYRDLWMWWAGALVVSGIALALGFFLGKRAT